MKNTTMLCAGILLLGTVVTASADNFRCPNGTIVSTGDSISVVALKCDPPAAVARREEPADASVTRPDGRYSTRTVYVEVQEWTYTQGSTLLHTLIFRNGTLAEVRTGGFIP